MKNWINKFLDKHITNKNTRCRPPAPYVKLTKENIMGNFKIKITEIYSYEIEVEAESKSEALKNAKKIYEEDYENYNFVADSTTLETTKYKVE
nr:hypothetical protein [Clostridium botulinum]